MISALLAVALLGKTEIFRLEHDTETDALRIVGADGVKREVAIMSPDEYAIMTGQVAQVWKSLNATRDARSKLHGKAVTEVTTNGNQKVTVERYDDGFVFTDRMTIKTRSDIDRFAAHRGSKSGRVMPKSVKPRNISDRQWQMRQRVKDALDGKVKVVNVEHDAVTGKDIVK